LFSVKALADLTIIVSLTVIVLTIFVVTDATLFMKANFLRLLETAITVSTLTYLLISVERLVGLCFVPLIFIKNIKASRL
jgi:hypothetical protein